MPAQEEPASTAPPACELRRSLRFSTTSASPTPVPERRSLRQHGSGAVVVASSKPAAPESRRRGLRQLSKASQRKSEAKERPEQPGEEGPRKKARNGDLTAAPVPQARTRSSQRESRAAGKVTEVAAAVSVSPGATKRARRGLAPSPGLEGQPERPRTRASKLSSGSTSMSTPSPKDSGKSAKPGQVGIYAEEGEAPSPKESFPTPHTFRATEP